MANRSFRSARADVYTRITDDIIAAIESGAGEWQMPWHHDGSSITRPRNVTSDPTPALTRRTLDWLRTSLSKGILRDTLKAILDCDLAMGGFSG
jgi:hypothetical protein